MKRTKTQCLLFVFTVTFLVNGSMFSQHPLGNYVVIDSADTQEQIIRKAANVTPSQRQYEWQKLELTGFIHFGINTYDNVEWGQRNTDITKFNPTEIDVKQWVRVFKDAGFKLIILTAKHHDGFCLWPSRFTDYSIVRTPFQNGKGDIVRDLSDACREAAVKFGVYLSPWDMHEKSYGTPEYNNYFMNQLSELLTSYGEISEVWFDGANGEGPNGKKQIYDWQSYYQLIRRLQPNAVIAVSGPDVRWVGTESGYGRQTEWSVLPGSSTNQEVVAANSQQHALDGAFIPRNLMDEDLGSREKIKTASSLVWYPAEIDVSIRPRWFYNPGDDDLVKSPDMLVDIYYNSAGLNGVLLLNIPPDKRGLIHKNDIKSLQGMRYILNETFNENLAVGATVEASNTQKGHAEEFILDDNLKTFWTTEETISAASLEITLQKAQTFNRAMLQENMLVGQRVEKFHLEWWNGHQWEKFTEGTTVGYKRLLRFPEVTTDKIKLVIDRCRINPAISFFGLYAAPPEINFQSNGESFADSIKVEITTTARCGKIFYSLDGSIPDKESMEYSSPIWLHKTTTVTAVAISKSGKESISRVVKFHKAKHSIRYNIPFSEKYTGGGVYALVNGVTGSGNFDDGRWQGFNGSDLDVVIDLGKEKKINKIAIGFLRDINSFIFLPDSVEYCFSYDKKGFTPFKRIKNDVQQNDNAPLIKIFEFHPQNISTRYIKVKAKNIGTCPEWHKGFGEKAWLFADEIVVN